jgi:hypothetical protein
MTVRSRRNLSRIVSASILGCVLMLAGGVASQAGAQSDGLPPQLTDREFWDLLVNLSEPDGFFEDENYVSNELGYQRSMRRLQQQVAPDGVFVGVGPEQNFHYIAAFKPSIAFIVDIRRQNAIEHLMYKALFELASDRVDFVGRLFSRPRPSGLRADADVAAVFSAYGGTRADEQLFRATLESIQQVLITRHGFPLDEKDRASLLKVFTAFRDKGPELMYVFRGTPEAHPTYAQLMTVADESGQRWSFLASDDGFEYVRSRQRQNLVVPVVGNFAGPKALKAIGDYVRGRNGRIELFYVSNVEPYLFAAGQSRQFYDNLLTMPFSDSATFIRTFFGATSRECGALRPTIRTPVVSSVTAVLDAHRSGALGTQCELVSLSK